MAASFRKLWTLALVAGVLALVLAGSALAEGVDADRASWLINRTGLEDLALTGQRFEQGEIGGAGGGAVEFEDLQAGPQKKGALPILFSLVLPGAGEAYMGYKRGYVMMAADIFAWTQVAKYHDEGKSKTDDYLAFADEHYSDERLVEAYKPGSLDPERSGEGEIYFPTIEGINGVEDLDNLPLYVTRAEDEREYYENLGKWEQFIFGWDDYTRASDAFNWPEGSTGPTGELSDLRQPWVSQNRQIYQEMRGDANDAYKTRDRWLYVNIGLRVFSVIQTAWLSGVIGGGGDAEMAIGDHEVNIIAMPAGWDRGTLAATVSF